MSHITRNSLATRINAGHLTSTAIENPRVDGSIPSQATNPNPSISNVARVFYFLAPKSPPKHKLPLPHKVASLPKGRPMKKLLATVLLLFSFSGITHAAESAPTKSDPTWLTESRASIKAGKFEQAVELLKAANESGSAEWNNLMGFSLRKKSSPDLNAAETYYEAALKIDPKHRSALEYYGELKLMKNDLPGAEALLARLDKACTFGCEEYTDLKQAVQKFKSQMRR